jgi:hypothetical protein
MELNKYSSEFILLSGHMINNYKNKLIELNGFYDNDKDVLGWIFHIDSQDNLLSWLETLNIKVEISLEMV